MLRLTKTAACSLALTLLVSPTARSVTNAPPDAEDLKRFPVKEIPGDPPASGLRHWTTPFRKLPYHVKFQGNSYVTVIQPKQGGVELWANSWGPDSATNRAVFVRRGASIDRLGAEEVVFDGTLITDVPAMDDPARPAPGRGFTRTTMFYAPDVGYILLCCVCPDYRPGSVPLIPALVRSRNGRPDSWEYLGKLAGEPAEEVRRLYEEKKRHVWSDGGSLVRLDDGTWRIYLNGFGQKLTAVVSDDIGGPWKFLREEGGAIRELLPDFPSGGIWANILRTAPGTWHLWLTDTWPPQSIWHYRSPDGLAWAPFGRQPEITRAAFAGQGIKCLRTHYDADANQIVGLLAVWARRPDGSKGWLSHVSRMPADLTPK